MPIDNARETLRITLRQRCFYLFATLLLLVMAVPFLEHTATGRIVLNALNLLILLTGAAVIGRGAGAVIIGLLLAAPAAGFQAFGFFTQTPQFFILSEAFSAAFYFITISYLLTYALRREVLTMDKLYGCAAAFLMLGALWALLYNILLYYYPGALTINGAPMETTPLSTILYFSFATLTATGMSDVLPAHGIARTLCSLEMITGVLYIALLIARLAGNYAPGER